MHPGVLIERLAAAFAARLTTDRMRCGNTGERRGRKMRKPKLDIAQIEDYLVDCSLKEARELLELTATAIRLKVAIEFMNKVGSVSK